MSYTVEHKDYQYVVGKYNGLTDVPHIHTHLEMIYLVQGRAKAVVDGRGYLMEAGDLFFAGSDQIHYFSTEEETVFWLILVAADMEPEFEERLKTRVPVCPVIPARLLPAELEQMLESVAEQCWSGDTYERLGAKGRFLSLMSTLLPLYDYKEAPRKAQDSFRQVLAYCNEHYTESITLDNLSARLHLSKFYLSHLFRQRLGIGFSEFLNQLRTEDACQRLRKGDEITQTAYDAGFSSIRTFNRVFRATTGMTPRDYVRRYATKEEN